MIDLGEEFSAAVCSITPERLAALRAADVPDISLPMVGMAPIETHAGGLFDIVDDGTLAAVVPIGEWDGVNWLLEDLVGFELSDPGRWWRRLGAVQILGTVPAEPVFPLRLYDTPLAWLLVGGRGAVIVDWRFDPEVLVGPIEVETRSLKARLERRIKDAALARFEISVREVRDAA